MAHGALEACRRLGHQFVQCVLFESSEIDAWMWEIAENLHRADLTVQERASILQSGAANLSTPLQASPMDTAGGERKPKLVQRSRCSPGAGRKSTKRCILRRNVVETDQVANLATWHASQRTRQHTRSRQNGEPTRFTADTAAKIGRRRCRRGLLLADAFSPAASCQCHVEAQM
jgi:hypothetical protein